MNKKALKIFELALKLNPSETKQGVTGNKPTVFVDFFGHTGQISIHIDYDGWPSSENKVLRQTLETDENFEFYSQQQLDEMIITLENLCEKWVTP